MRTFINQNRFLKAVAYVSANHFSKPYSLSPMVDRWFNQLAMIELHNGKLLHFSEPLAREHLTISVNGNAISQEDLNLIFKFYSKNSEYEKERKQIKAKIKEIKNQIKLDSNNSELGKLESELKKQEKLLADFDADFDADKKKAKTLYDSVVESGEAKLNEESLETKYKSKIKHIVYRPNHGLTHSVRAAYMVTAIQAFEEEHERDAEELTNDDNEIEKLQMMMLFSVVGRRDETGFNDGSAGRATYESFRTTSGKEYLKYCKMELQELYHDDLEALYRDAIIVELMGYSSIDDCYENRDDPPELLIDYVIAKEQSKGKDISREKALTAITKNKYSLISLFPKGAVRELADAKLDMMNKAHAIELVRCYPLYPTKPGGAKSLGIIRTYLSQSGLMDKESATVENLESAFKIMRCCFDSMTVTGQQTTFGFLSQTQFDARKETILEAIKTINARFTAENKETLIKEMEAAKEELGEYFTLRGLKENTLLDRYRKLLILKETAKHLTDSPRLLPDKKMFDYQHSEPNSPHKVNHEQNALSLLDALQQVIPVKGADSLPTISSVTHDRIKNQVTLVFDDEEMAEFFVEQYANYSPEKLDITENSEKQFTVVADRTTYQKMLQDKRIQFKQVSIPKEVSREKSLLTESGHIEALDLIADSRALGRLISTTALNGETFPDYDYFLKAMDDPIHERYASPIPNLPQYPANKATYYDPRTGDLHQRKISTEPLPELRFQEPVTEPKRFDDQVQDGLTVGKSNQPKNTIFIKKLAHSLLPPHGKVKPFPGYRNKRSKFFPIGFLSDVQEVDLKSERYLWAKNMATVQKYWLRDTSKIDQVIYKLLHAKRDSSSAPVFDAKGGILLDAAKLTTAPSADDLIKYLQEHAKKIHTQLDIIHYRPTRQSLENIKTLLKQERDEYLKQLKGKNLANGVSAEEQCKELYAELEERVTKEEARQDPKYAITLKELVELQKQSDKAEDHNEILAGNTKGAMRALYAPQDTLFDRLNLAFHAMQIKKQYHYDVPLIITSQDKPPYHYTEAKIKADLKEAYELLRQGKFPYDRSLHPVYEEDSQGKIVLKNGQPVIKTASKGRQLQEPKSLKYQQDLLRDLFQIGFPEITTINNLTRGQVKRKRLDGKLIDEAIDSIIEKMDIIGGLARESELMEDIFDGDDEEQKAEFFLRTATLGHASLIKEMLEDESFELPILEKAIQRAEQNNYPAVIQALNDFITAQAVELKEAIDELTEELEPEERAKTAHDLLLFVVQRSAKEQGNPEAALPGLRKLMDNALSALKTEEQSEEGMQLLGELFKSNPECITHYAQILISNQTIDTDTLLLQMYYEKIKTTIDELQKPDNPLSAEQKIALLLDVQKDYLRMANNDDYEDFAGNYELDDLKTDIQDITAEVLLNPTSRNATNQASIDPFMQLLAEHPEYVKAYASILASNQSVPLEQLIAAHHRFDPPLNVDIVSKAMVLVASRGWEDANLYMLLHEFNEPVVAAQYFAAENTADAQKQLASHDLKGIIKLITEMPEDKPFELLVIEKATQLAEQSNHPGLTQALRDSITVKAIKLKETIDKLSQKVEPEKRIKTAKDLLLFGAQLSTKEQENSEAALPNLSKLMRDVLSTLTTEEQSEEHMQLLSELFKNNPEDITHYAQILISNQTIDMDILFKVQHAQIKTTIDELKKPDNALSAEQKIALLFNIQKDYLHMANNDAYQDFEDQNELKDLKTVIQDITAEVLLNPASRNATNQASIVPFMQLLEEHPEYVKAYANIRASNQNVPLEQLIEAHHRFDPPLNVDIVSKAMVLAASRGWEDANNYMLLHEFNKPVVADQYFAAENTVDAQKELEGNNLKSIVKQCRDLIEEMEPQGAETTRNFCEQMREEIKPEKANFLFLAMMLPKLQEMQRMESITRQCFHLIEQIEQQGMGNMDTATRDYCQQMRDTMQQNQGDIKLLTAQLEQLKDTYAAVNSVEMQAVKEQINRLEKNAKSIFAFGNQNKANQIKAAVATVPLAERATVFSKEYENGNPVQIALASHRLSWTNPVKAHNKINEIKAAESYKKVQQRIKNPNDSNTTNNCKEMKRRLTELTDQKETEAKRPTPTKM